VIIAKGIRDIKMDQVVIDYNKLVDEGNKLKADKTYEISTFSRIGNKAVDFFTFPERLNTAGNKHINFYALWKNVAKISQKPYVKSFIQNSYPSHDTDKLKKTQMTKVQIYYKVFTMYYGSIYIFKPTIALSIYHRFNPTCVLDMTMGWGGRLMGACALNVKKYIGIDSNIGLKQPYTKMVKFLKGNPKSNTSMSMTDTEIELRFEDALKVDYSKLKYDMVFTSPPYFDIERYGQDRLSNKYTNKMDWKEQFYFPLIRNTFKHLSKGGHYCLNVPIDIYEKVCIPCLGEADILIPLDIKGRGINEYKEFIYVWKK
jgi:hypothetical protein